MLLLSIESIDSIIETTVSVMLQVLEAYNFRYSQCKSRNRIMCCHCVLNFAIFISALTKRSFNQKERFILHAFYFLWNMHKKNLFVVSQNIVHAVANVSVFRKGSKISTDYSIEGAMAIVDTWSEKFYIFFVWDWVVWRL